MNRPKLDTVDSAIAANLDALSHRLAQASALALSGAAAMASVALLYVDLAVLFVLHMRPARLRERSERREN